MPEYFLIWLLIWLPFKNEEESDTLILHLQPYDLPGSLINMGPQCPAVSELTVAVVAVVEGE